MHGAGDEGSTVQSRGSINRRQAKNQRDGPGSQVRGSAQMNAASGQNKPAQSNAAVGNASATGVYHSASKTRQMASNVSQGANSAHQQRSNSKAYSHASDGQ